MATTHSAYSFSDLESMSIESLESLYCYSFESSVNSTRRSQSNNSNNPHITGLCLYPIKSCRPMPVNSWPIVSHGFYLDRHFCLYSNSIGKYIQITRSVEPLKIYPFLDLKKQCLIIASPSMNNKNFILKLEQNEFNTESELPLKSLVIVGERTDQIMQDCGNDVSDWLNEALNRNDIRLLRQVKLRSNNFSLTSDSHIQIMNLASLEQLIEEVAEDQGYFNTELHMFTPRFRANILVRGIPAEDEIKWANIKIKDVKLNCFDRVERCPAINADLERLEFEQNPLKFLLRKSKGKPLLGVHSNVMQADYNWISVNDDIEILSLK